MLDFVPFSCPSYVLDATISKRALSAIVWYTVCRAVNGKFSSYACLKFRFHNMNVEEVLNEIFADDDSGDEDVPSEKSDNELSDYEEIEDDNSDLEYVPSCHVVASSYYLPPPVHDVHESDRSD
jgi:hypothetical protein